MHGRAQRGIAPTLAGRRRSRRHRAVDPLLLALAGGAGARYLWWRAGQWGQVGPAAKAFWVVEACSVLALVLTGAVVAARGRASRPPPPVPTGALTLDVLIPVAGEPVDLVRATVLAATGLTYPCTVTICVDGTGTVDTDGMEQLATELGVACHTRRLGQPGKAGNLNHALRHTHGDVVLVIDADHAVEPGAGEALMGWFDDPVVGFVTTPQRFHDGRRDPLNPEEPLFYRAVQPGRDAWGLAFSTGNAVAYRRRALEEVGGFSEWSLVEDLHTSLRLHAAGWSSVYHPVPLSTGLSPATSAEFARQRLRWATDSLRILFYDCPLLHRGLDLRARLLYLQVVGMYVLIAAQVGFLLGPPAWILGRVTVTADAPGAALVSYLAPWLLAVVLCLVAWAGPRGAVRTVRNAFLLAPVFLVALGRAVRRTPRRGGATAKVHPRRFSWLLAVAAAPTLLLAASVVWAVFDRRPGGSPVATLWACGLLALAAGPFLHFGARRAGQVAQALVVAAAVAVAAGAVATGRYHWEAPLSMYSSMRGDPAWRGQVVELNHLGAARVTGPAVPAPAARPVPVTAGSEQGEAAGTSGPRTRLEPGEGIYLGVATDDFPYDMAAIGRWSARVAAPQIVHWYQQWDSGETRFRGDWLAAVDAAGAVPMISWEPWAKPEGYSSPDQPLGRLDAIAAGDHDAYLQQWAEAAAAYGRPLLLRPFHEMNGFWYPWSVGVNGNTAEDFVAAWRHVHERFRLAGADNVSWVWSINTLALFEQGDGVEDYYPGDDVVDWVATSGFNWGSSHRWSRWLEAEVVFGHTYDLLTQFGKPVMLAEVGTVNAGGDGTRWASEALEAFARLPALRAVVWFDKGYDDHSDFRLQPDQDRALRAAIARLDRYQPPLRLRAVQAGHDPSVPVQGRPR